MRQNEKGQGVMEYIIMVALIAIASIAVMKILGQNVRAQLGRISRGISGHETSVTLENVEGSQLKKRGMDDYDINR